MSIKSHIERMKDRCRENRLNMRSNIKDCVGGGTVAIREIGHAVREEKLRKHGVRCLIREPAAGYSE
jgi:hypothetical protein